MGNCYALEVEGKPNKGTTWSLLKTQNALLMAQVQKIQDTQAQGLLRLTERRYLVNLKWPTGEMQCGSFFSSSPWVIGKKNLLFWKFCPKIHPFEASQCPQLSWWAALSYVVYKDTPQGGPCLDAVPWFPIPTLPLKGIKVPPKLDSS